MNNKKLTLIIAAGLFFLNLAVWGCNKKPASGPVLARINNYTMTVEDFANELSYSGYRFNDTPDLPKMLDVAIDKQLLIQEAQRRGLHQQKTFLKTIERYWEQTLIKELMDAETKHIQNTVAPPEQEQALQDWLNELRKNAAININQGLLQSLSEKNPNKPNKNF